MLSILALAGTTVLAGIALAEPPIPRAEELARTDLHRLTRVLDGFAEQGLHPATLESIQVRVNKGERKGRLIIEFDHRTSRAITVRLDQRTPTRNRDGVDRPLDLPETVVLERGKRILRIPFTYVPVDSHKPRIVVVLTVSDGSVTKTIRVTLPTN